MYKVVLSDGTKIDKLELNGNNYITSKSIDTSVFDGKTDKIIVVDPDGNKEVINNFKIVFTNVLGRQSFIIHKKNKEELKIDSLYQLIADLTETVLLGGE